MRPSCTISKRSATMNALAMSWVTTIEVTCSFSFMVTISSLIRRVLDGSRPVVGSSYKMTSGSAAVAGRQDGARQGDTLSHPTRQIGGHELGGFRQANQRQALVYARGDVVFTHLALLA